MQDKSLITTAPWWCHSHIENVTVAHETEPGDGREDRCSCGQRPQCSRYPRGSLPSPHITCCSCVPGSQRESAWTGRAADCRASLPLSSGPAHLLCPLSIWCTLVPRVSPTPGLAFSRVYTINVFHRGDFQAAQVTQQRAACSGFSTRRTLPSGPAPHICSPAAPCSPHRCTLRIYGEDIMQ